MLERMQELVRQKQDFAFESTLASRSFAPFLKTCRAEGYHVHLIYLWLHSSDLAVARVAARVKSGGHSIPEATIRRRYERGLQKLSKLYLPFVDEWRIYDNSLLRPELIAYGKNGKNATSEIKDFERWEKIVGNFYATR